MKVPSCIVHRAPCAYFFLCPGMAYGIITSRLPALQIQTGASESDIGLLLLCLGFSSVIALLVSARLIALTGSRRLLRVASLLLILSVALCGLPGHPLRLGVVFAGAGLGMGLTDVSMNTQGMLLERRLHTSCLSFMHAAYSFGGVLGALSGSLFAGLGLGVSAQACCVFGLYLCLHARASAALLHDEPVVRTQAPVSDARALPPFILLCGVGAMLASSAEGAVAEWGGLLLVSVKGTQESTAALVFAVFSATTVFCRLFGDRLRQLRSDAGLVFLGGTLSVCGMSLLLFAAHPALCLAGCALMGAGLSPVVPVLFSRAGSVPGVNPGRASAAVSMLSYSGMLFFPPLLGMVAQSCGLSSALRIILAVCLVITAGSVMLKNVPGTSASARRR